jgi:prepilin-type N-terminal cleavage/methylation domain-containing protein
VTRARARGITLIEMLVVLTLISLLAGLSFPSVSSGIDSLRLRSAADSVVTFLHLGLTYAERRQEALEIVISRAENRISFHAIAPGFNRELRLPDGITITRVLPELDEEVPAPERRILLYPSGSFPRFGVEIANRRNVHRLIRVDPVTGVPQIEAEPAQPVEER